MNTELGFRVILVALYIFLFGIRGYYARKAQRSGRLLTRKRWEEQVKREGKLSISLRAITFLLFVTLMVLYAIYPRWMTRFRLPFPTWLRWVGVALGLGSFPLLVWVHRTLGKHWSLGLELREEHTLVTRGPYHWVRHPMYTGVFAFLIALGLVSANWLILLIPVGGITLLLARIPKEERMMIEQFGDEYRAYMERTGRLLPRLFR